MALVSPIKAIISEVISLLFRSEKEDAIERALNILIDYFKIDWVYVAMFDADNRVANLLYEVTSSRFQVSRDEYVALTSDTIPWMIRTLVAGNDILVYDMDDLPPEAAVDVELFRREGLASMLAIPLQFKGENRGFIGFDSVYTRHYWTSLEVENVRIIANIFSIIIERQYRKQDISDSNRRLLESDARFRMAFSNLPVGVELYNSDGVLVDVNEADIRIFESTREDMLGVNLFDNPHFTLQMAETLDRGDQLDISIDYNFGQVVHYFANEKRGGVKHLHIKGLTLRGENGDRIGYMFIVSDNTESRAKQEMETKLRQAEVEKHETELEMEKVRESDKLKSAFLANISHEIRTPLNAIIGFSGILSEAEDHGERRHYQEVINKNSSLLLQLISDILDFSKIEAGVLAYQMEEVELTDLFQDIREMYTTSDYAHLAFVFREEEHPPLTICTDEKRIRQILNNLISNAFKFTPRGQVELSYRVEGDFVRVSVADTGIGISPENLLCVFERFVKIDNFTQGTGLGLSISKTIVEALRGEMGVESELGKGSLFWFTLPLNMCSLPGAGR